MSYNILELKALYEAKREPFERKNATPITNYAFFFWLKK